MNMMIEVFIESSSNQPISSFFLIPNYYHDDYDEHDEHGHHDDHDVYDFSNHNDYDDDDDYDCSIRQILCRSVKVNFFS